MTRASMPSATPTPLSWRYSEGAPGGLIQTITIVIQTAAPLGSRRLQLQVLDKNGALIAVIASIYTLAPATQFAYTFGIAATEVASAPVGLSIVVAAPIEHVWLPPGGSVVLQLDGAGVGDRLSQFYIVIDDGLG